MDYDTFDDIAGSLPRFINDVYNAKHAIRRSDIGALSPSKRSAPGR